MKSFYHIIFASIFMLPQLSWGQLRVNSEGNNSDPAYLIQNVLIGQGVQVSNFQSYGNENQFGFFTNGATAVEMDSGIVLSSGYAAAADPSYPVSNGFASFSFTDNGNQGGGDADLLQLSHETANQLGISRPDQLLDAAWISFDFIPISDSVTFELAFGSEEYGEYENSQYNDIFGFFVAGPDISGNYGIPTGYSSPATNVALIPGQDLAVTVSSVNSSRNSQLFQSNEDGSLGSHYQGFTRRLKITFPVTPCEQHHFRLAIADGTQNNYDSSVFLEAGSFSSSKFAYTVDGFSLPPGDRFPEGCGVLNVNLNRLQGVNENDTLAVMFGPGSEADQNDIGPLPTELVFQPGERQKTISFPIINEGVLEGDEVLELLFVGLNGCYDDLLIPVVLQDYVPHQVLPIGNDTLEYGCGGDNIEVVAEMQDGYGFYQYSWEIDGQAVPNESDSNLVVDLSSNADSVTVFVSDTCTNMIAQRTFYFKRSAYNPPTIYLPDEVNFPCAEGTVTLIPDSISGGAAPFNYSWMVNNEIIATSYSTSVDVTGDTKVYFSVVDGCGGTALDSVLITTNEFPPLRVAQNWTDTAVCVGGIARIFWEASGGAGTYRADWGDNTPGTVQEKMFVPLRDSVITLTISDQCGEEEQVQYFLDVNDPLADFEIRYKGPEVFADNYSRGRQLKSEWYVDDSLVSTEFNVNVPLVDYFDHTLTLVVEDIASCTDSLSKIFGPPLPVYAPRAFTPNGDGLNDTWQVSAPTLDRFEIWIFDRLGNEVFHSEDQNEAWDGVLKGTGERTRGVFTAKVIAVRGPQRLDLLVSIMLIQ